MSSQGSSGNQSSLGSQSSQSSRGSQGSRGSRGSRGSQYETQLLSRTASIYNSQEQLQSMANAMSNHYLNYMFKDKQQGKLKDDDIKLELPI